MQTISERFNPTVEMARKAATMVNVIRTGLFGVYQYKIGNIEFEQKQTNPGSRYSRNYWIMTTNGKTVTLPYKYVIYISFKKLKLI